MDEPAKKKLPTNRPLDALDTIDVGEVIRELLDRLPEEERFAAIAYAAHQYAEPLTYTLREVASTAGATDADGFTQRLLASGLIAPDGVREEHVWAYLIGILARASGYIFLQGEPEEDRLGEEQQRIPDEALRKLFGPD